jgi:hypothetical protein
MVIVFIRSPSESKWVVSTTSDFQSTGNDFIQVSDNPHHNFSTYGKLTAEFGLRIGDPFGAIWAGAADRGDLGACRLSTH